MEQNGNSWTILLTPTNWLPYSRGQENGYRGDWVKQFKPLEFEGFGRSEGMKKYIWVKEFELGRYGEDDEYVDDLKPVLVNSIWRLINGNFICTDLWHLECISDDCDFSWIEISKEMLKEYFEVIEWAWWAM